MWVLRAVALTASVVLVLVCCAQVASADGRDVLAGRAPSPPQALAATPDLSLRDVAFADARHGWAVGYDGVILATTDGGATWKRQQSGTSTPLSDVAFADATHGWAVGSDFWADHDVLDAVVLTTHDAGATWSVRDLGLESVPNSVACIDAQTAWIGFWQRLLATEDGGATWSELRSSDGGAEDFASLTFVDTTHGWAVSRDGSEVVATQDGGVTWTTVYSQKDATLSSVTFSDASHGWIAGSVLVKRPSEKGRVAQGLILATRDGGATWRAQMVQGRGWGRWWLKDVAFVDDRHGWAVGGFTKGVNSYGLILGTADGGVTWRPKTLQDAGLLLAVAAADASHGWAAGTYGLRSTSADYGPPLFAPAIKSFRPTSGRPGTVVTITGAGFKGVFWATFGGTVTRPKVVSATTIKATVPVGAASGPIIVKGPAGAGVSSTSFTVR